MYVCTLQTHLLPTQLVAFTNIYIYTFWRAKLGRTPHGNATRCVQKFLSSECIKHRRCHNLLLGCL